MAEPPTGGMVIPADPEDEDLDTRRRRMEKLSEEVAEREMRLSGQRLALARFQLRYYQTIGRRYAELDEIRAAIARQRRLREPENEDWLREEWYRRFRAERSAREYEEFKAREATEPVSPNERGSGDEAKKLYRSIAVQIHPDRADDEASRAYRTRLMSDLNAAWARGDTGRMKAILEEWLTSPEAVAGEGRQAELERLDRTIDRLEQRLSAIDSEMARLSASEFGQLMLRAAAAAARGRDLLADLAAELELKIELARRELDEFAREETPCP